MEFLHQPKKISWDVWKPFVLSLSKHERFPHSQPFGEHSKLRSPSTDWRTEFGMLNCGF